MASICESCARKTTCNSPLLQPIAKKCKALIVLDYPDYHEDMMATPFQSSSTQELRKLMYDVGLDPNDVAWAYACPCKPVDGGNLKLKEIKECSQQLKEYIELVEPEYILVCGDIALYSLTQLRGITKKRGKIITTNNVILGVDTNILPTYSPKALGYSKQLEPVIKSDLKFFASRVLNKGLNNLQDFDWQFLERSDLNKVIKEIKDTDYISYDVETTGLDANTSIINILGICLKVEDKFKSYILINENSSYGKNGCSPSYLYKPEELKNIVNIANKSCAHNSKFDNKFLNRCDLTTPSIKTTFDTMLAAYLIDETLPHDLKYWAKTVCGADDYASEIDFNVVTPLPELGKYCALDCYYTLKLKDYFLNELKQDKGKLRVFAHILMPGSRMLEDVEERGVFVDRFAVQQVLDVVEGEIKASKGRLDAIIPESFYKNSQNIEINYNSPTQIKKLLYEPYGFNLKPIKVTTFEGEEDDSSTGKAILKKYARKGNEFCQELLEYRKYSKMKSGFLEPWLEKLQNKNRLYPSYNIARTATGRLSANNPNLQQVSRDKSIRNLVSARPGHVFIEADYSQIELRVAAWIGNINSMKKLYQQGEDLHTNTARMIVQLGHKDWDSLDKATKKEYRTRAKAVNFGFIYGMSWQGFKEYAESSYDVLLTDEEAQQYRETYFRLYPELTGWHKRTREKAKKEAKVVSPLGRVRYLHNIKSYDKLQASKAERCALNTPVQSLASDLTLLSMIKLDEIFKEQQMLEARIVGQCHDAIFFEVHESTKDEVCKIIHDVMTKPETDTLFGVSMDVPIEVEIKVGKAWGDGEVWEEVKSNGV